LKRAAANSWPSAKAILKFTADRQNKGNNDLPVGELVTLEIYKDVVNFLKPEASFPLFSTSFSPLDRINGLTVGL
jgi:hypothetical protein